MKFNLSAGISELAKENDVPFNLPMFEAITNSIQANARNINIEFIVDHVDFGRESKINGFTIKDDGDGFNTNNINSFNIYKTDLKKSLGCKGVGRLTWLVVYKNVFIESISNNKLIKIHFTQKYEKEKDCVVTNVASAGQSNYTKISFNDVTPQFLNKDKYNYRDKRANANLNDIKMMLLVEFMMLLYNKHAEGIKIVINLKIDSNKVSLSVDDIFNFTKKVITLSPKVDKTVSEDFNFFYSFKEVDTPIINYVADSRRISTICPKLPKEVTMRKEQLVMFVTSDVFDDTVDDSRTKLLLSNKPSLLSKFTDSEINDAIIKEYLEIVMEKYPELKEFNDKVVKSSINEYPFLAKFIATDNEIIKDPTRIIENALKAFQNEKKRITTDFKKMLSTADVDSVEFDRITSEITELQAIELGEYVAFRQQIIEGLKKLSTTKKVLEKKIHNLFMTMGDDSYGNVYDSNLWLLDDKFMSFSYSASDKSLNFLKKKLDEECPADDRVEPDITIFYSNPEDEIRDAVLIEIKGIGTGNKSIALNEINRNVGLLRENFPNINQLWAYIITDIDDDFERSIRFDTNYKKAFSNGKSMYYAYFPDPVDATIYIIDVKSIVIDADQRNRVFLDILKGKHGSAEN